MSEFIHPPVNGRLSIIIPNWNGKHHLETCLPSLVAQTHSDIEVIIADNASTDGTQAFVGEHFPQFLIEQLPENRGFTGACNAGMRVATGEFIALLNNDTEVDPNWAAQVIAALGRHPEAGFVASKMLLFDQRDTFHTTGDFYRVDGQPGNRGVWQQDTGQYETEEYVFSACGGSSVYRRSMLEKIGLLDDDFFFSLEDVDLAWRAQLQGYRCIYAPQAIVYHKLSASGGGATASFHDGRNTLYVLIKNYPTALWRRYGWVVLRNQSKIAWSALRAWRGAAARAKLRGMLAGILTLPRMLPKRRAIQQSRCVSIEYLESVLTPVYDKRHAKRSSTFKS
ncbi:MAG: glycosyltransferase family 2 protein [Chloroflexi bacterium]|nr:glycosyltransferase family 2 protein [Chloroflexota bacterium]